MYINEKTCLAYSLINTDPIRVKHKKQRIVVNFVKKKQSDNGFRCILYLRQIRVICLLNQGNVLKNTFILIFNVNKYMKGRWRICSFS